MPDSYIVHVYRRQYDGSVIGMVERVGDHRRSPFRSPEELWALLDTTRRPDSPRQYKEDGEDGDSA